MFLCCLSCVIVYTAPLSGVPLPASLGVRGSLLRCLCSATINERNVADRPLADGCRLAWLALLKGLRKIDKFLEFLNVDKKEM